jgi:HAD superfamily hydrolase (TIGR01509 family)
VRCEGAGELSESNELNELNKLNGLKDLNGLDKLSERDMIKAVVFDLGKVLLDFDYTIAIRRIARRCTIALPEILHFITHDPLLLRYETGLLTTDQFYRQIGAVTGFAGDREEFATLFGDIFAPIEPMIQLHAALRQRGFATYIFSNTNELAIEHIRQSFAFFRLFDGYVLSYEHRVMKPEAGLYEAFERQSGRHGGEILYLDDRPENVAAGAARGWQVILHESPEESRTKVVKLGLLDHAGHGGA